MCRPVRCKTCGKTTWAGCGRHVHEVMAGVSSADRCPGHSASERSRSGIVGRLFTKRGR